MQCLCISLKAEEMADMPPQEPEPQNVEVNIQLRLKGDFVGDLILNCKFDHLCLCGRT